MGCISKQNLSHHLRKIPGKDAQNMNKSSQKPEHPEPLWNPAFRIPQTPYPSPQTTAKAVVPPEERKGMCLRKTKNKWKQTSITTENNWNNKTNNINKNTVKLQVFGKIKENNFWGPRNFEAKGEHMSTSWSFQPFPKILVNWEVVVILKRVSKVNKSFKHIQKYSKQPVKQSENRKFWDDRAGVFQNLQALLVGGAGGAGGTGSLGSLSSLAFSGSSVGRLLDSWA